MDWNLSSFQLFHIIPYSLKWYIFQLFQDHHAQVDVIQLRVWIYIKWMLIREWVAIILFRMCTELRRMLIERFWMVMRLLLLYHHPIRPRIQIIINKVLLIVIILYLVKVLHQNHKLRIINDRSRLHHQWILLPPFLNFKFDFNFNFATKRNPNSNNDTKTQTPIIPNTK